MHSVARHRSRVVGHLNGQPSDTLEPADLGGRFEPAEILVIAAGRHRPAGWLALNELQRSVENPSNPIPDST